MDTAKKLKICEGNLVFKEIYQELIVSQLYTIKKAIIFNNLILTSMENKENIFKIENFKNLIKNKHF